MVIHSTLITFLLLFSPQLSAQKGAPVAPVSKVAKPLTGTNRMHASRRFVVGMNPGGDLASTAQLMGAKVVASIPGLAPVGLLEFPPSTIAALGQATIMSGMGVGAASIGFMEPVRKLGAPLASGCTSKTGPPAIPLSGSGCIAFFDGTPTPSEYFNQPALAAIDVSSIQASLVGNISIVAVIDTGIDASHLTLAGKVLPFGYDFVGGDTNPMEVANGIDDDFDGLVDEAYGHGTHLAGTIVLLNPDARILPLRVLDSDGNGTSFNVAQGIYFAIASGADVINLSLGMTSNSRVVRDAVNAALDAGIEVLAAAGNSNQPLVQFPARINDVIAVSAVDSFDQKATFSSYGIGVSLSAPGTNIYSTMPGNQFAWWSGTSMATAVASGSVSLLHSLTGVLFDVGTGESLEDSSVSIDAFNPLYYEQLGDGRLDPNAAVPLVLSSL